MGSIVGGVSTGITNDTAIINPLDRNNNNTNTASNVMNSNAIEEFKSCFDKEEITYAKINKIILESNLKNQPAG